MSSRSMKQWAIRMAPSDAWIDLQTVGDAACAVDFRGLGDGVAVARIGGDRRVPLVVET